MTLGVTVFANCLLIDILSGNSFFLRCHITTIKPMNARDFSEKVRAIDSGNIV